MFLFLGDSFTWGQGLYFEKWIIENQKSKIDKINKLTPADLRHECFSFEDNQFRIQNSFPYIVSSHYNMNYFNPRWLNGGSNYDIFYQLKSLPPSTIDPVTHIIIQLTDFWRPMPNNLTSYFTKKEQEGVDIHNLEKKYGRDISIFNKMIDTQLSILSEIFNNLGDKIKIYVLCWQNDISEKFIQKFGNELLIPIRYNDVYYNSFDWMLDTVSLQKKYGIFDNHFSIEGHHIISNSIIEKIGKINTTNKNYLYLENLKINE